MSKATNDLPKDGLTAFAKGSGKSGRNITRRPKPRLYRCEKDVYRCGTHIYRFQIHVFQIHVAPGDLTDLP